MKQWMLWVTVLGALGEPAGAQEVIFAVDGPYNFSVLRNVAGCGDLDFDGYPEVLVGTPGTSGPGTTGLVWVLSGQDASVLYEHTGEVPPDGLGTSLAGLGHFDGDDVPDYAAGDPTTTVSSERDGKVVVYSGRDGSEIVSLPGWGPNDRFGRWVAGIGDVNQDGFDDLAAVGIYNTVRIHLGPDGALLRTHSGPGTRTSVAAVGDVDQDGHPDYAIGWPQDSTNGQWTGRVSVFSGRDGSEIHRVHGTTPNGPSTSGDHLGLAVSAAGDLDGDGVLDFVAGAPGEIDYGYQATQGSVRVYSGVDAHVLLHLEGEDYTHYYAQFGHRIAGGKDVNGDGTPDILVGAPNGGFVIQGEAFVFSGSTAMIVWRLKGVETGMRLGTGLALLDDTDLDGIADFAIGDVSSFGLDWNGRVTVYAGARGDAVRYCDTAPNSTGPGASIDLDGPIGIGNNELVLLATGAVPGELGLFFYGEDAVQLPFGDGFRCVGGATFRLGPPQTVGPDGSDLRPLDFTAPPMDSGPGAVTPGSTWSFQHWYRDPQGPGGSGFNLSDALRIQFTP